MPKCRENRKARLKRASKQDYRLRRKFADKILKRLSGFTTFLEKSPDNAVYGDWFRKRLSGFTTFLEKGGFTVNTAPNVIDF